MQATEGSSNFISLITGIPGVASPGDTDGGVTPAVALKLGLRPQVALLLGLRAFALRPRFGFRSQC